VFGCVVHRMCSLFWSVVGTVEVLAVRAGGCPYFYLRAVGERRSYRFVPCQLGGAGKRSFVFVGNCQRVQASKKNSHWCNLTPLIRSNR